jgi:hypothetical protein
MHIRVLPKPSLRQVVQLLLLFIKVSMTDPEQRPGRCCEDRNDGIVPHQKWVRTKRYERLTQCGRDT